MRSLDEIGKIVEQELPKNFKAMNHYSSRVMNHGTGYPVRLEVWYENPDVICLVGHVVSSSSITFYGYKLAKDDAGKWVHQSTCPPFIAPNSTDMQMYTEQINRFCDAFLQALSGDTRLHDTYDSD